MTHEEKTIKFIKKDFQDKFSTKTPYEELPFKIGYGSSSHHPERKGGITTCDIVLWCKFIDRDWFRPYGNFTMGQIEDMMQICSNDNQVVSLIEMLSIKH